MPEWGASAETTAGGVTVPEWRVSVSLWHQSGAVTPVQASCRGRTGDVLPYDKGGPPVRWTALQEN